MIKTLADRLLKAWEEHERLDTLHLANKGNTIIEKRIDSVYREITSLEALIMCQTAQDHEENMLKLVILANRIEAIISDYDAFREEGKFGVMGFSEMETASCLETISSLIMFQKKEGYSCNERLMDMYWSPKLHPDPYEKANMLKAA